MADLLFAGGTALFFALMGLYTRGCAALGYPAAGDDAKRGSLAP